MAGDMEHTRRSEEYLFAVVDATADGDNELIAAVSGRKIRVLSYALSVDVTGEINIESGAATSIARLFLLAGSPSNYGAAGIPAFETVEGENLNLVNPAGTDTTGHITYILTQ